MKLLLEQWRGYLKEEESPQTVYHGTSLNRWNKLKQGGYETDLLYFAINPDGTDMYSRMAVENDEIEFDIEQEDNPPIMVHLDFAQLEANGELGRDWDDTPEGLSWEESIEYGGTASFRGNLKNAIKKVEVFE